MKSSPAESGKKTTLSQAIFSIIVVISDRFKISPFEVEKEPFEDVVDMWEQIIISTNDANADKKEIKAKQNEEERVRVYSYNATWH